MMKVARAVVSLAAAALFVAGCKESEPSSPKPERLSVDELKDPETCKSCHPTHYREWKASMHAYSTEDPVFVAMNKLGYEETDGELGTFCVNCHAPMAVKEGLTDGSPESVADIPDHMQGVTCYFCHNATEVEGESNAEITLGNDDVMRGGIVGAIEPKAHGVAYSRFMNRYAPDSSRMCGGCHDIVTDSGVHLERTFAEYNTTIFADADKPNDFLSCVSCHMPNREGLAATSTGREGDQLATRDVHSHLWPGVDVAMSSWHDREAYEAAVACALDQSISVIRAEMSSDPQKGLEYEVETQAGHNMPSGASQDRRLWLEVKMFGENGDEPLCTLGAVPDGVAAATFVDPKITCPTTFAGDRAFPLFRDRVFDANGDETHMFWRAAPSEEYESGVIAESLPGATMRDANGDPVAHSVAFDFQPMEGATRITVRMRMRPMDHDVLEELIAEGVLDESIHDEVRTFTLDGTAGEFLLEGSEWVWYERPERATDCYDAFFCAFDRDAPLCD